MLGAQMLQEAVHAGLQCKRKSGNIIVNGGQRLLEFLFQTPVARAAEAGSG